MDDGLFRVAAPGEQRHRPLAPLPARDASADLDDLAGALEAEDRRGTRRRRIETLALQEIRSIDGGSPYSHAKIAGTQGRRRHIAQVKH